MDWGPKRGQLHQILNFFFLAEDVIVSAWIDKSLRDHVMHGMIDIFVAGHLFISE